VSLDSTDPNIGRLLDGRYQIRSRIARGGMATVYLATDLRLERRVAIKVMHGHLADDSQFKQRFIQEARSAARLAHPNVVNVFDQGQDSEMAYLVMEYLPGITLRELLQEHRVLTTEQTLDIMEAVLGGLAAAHKAGIVHRDLKPENVLLADDGRIKIGDFGLARAASANTATGAALLGTIAYLSPELVTRGIADTRSDIYAAGIMMFEMLVGEQPFKGDQPMRIAYQHANDAVPTPSSRNPRVPAEVDDLVLWATARQPDDRPKDAREMLDQLYLTHSALMTALPSKTGSTPTQRTMVIPSAAPAQLVDTPAQPTDETQVLGSRGSGTPRPAASTGSNTVALTHSAQKRRRRGWWLAAIVAVLVVLAGGTGWYFGAGPGSLVTIPQSIVGMSVDEASAALAKLGFTLNPSAGNIDSPTVPVGAVAATTPAVGASVARGAAIQLLVSTGPKEIAVPAFAGMTEEQATAAIAAAPFTLTATIRQFDATTPKGLVIDVLGGNGASIMKQSTYGDRQPVSLIVSAGALPDVACKSVSEATTILAGVNLTAQSGKQEFNDCPAGSVSRIDPETDANGNARVFREGDTVSLIVSRGPDLVEVPNVVGGNIAAAKAQLEGLGFVVTVDTTIQEVFWSFPPAVVTGQDPAGSTMIKRGSTVTISG
jgi:serine/threonine-protein kinase